MQTVCCFHSARRAAANWQPLQAELLPSYSLKHESPNPVAEPLECQESTANNTHYENYYGKILKYVIEQQIQE